ncbi:MAG: guanylate kinase [Planctomycetales bacterium]|nr:guanylate kinase [Planctomycetales bacterium]
MPNQPGKLVVISGPAGAGKSTIVREVLAACPAPLELSVSATTRAPRPGERDGVDYHFLTDEEFQRRRKAGEFLEAFEVFGKGCWYGTLNETVTTGLAAGKWVLLEIDVSGAMAVVERFPQAILFLSRPDSFSQLQSGRRVRATESDEAIEYRLETARHEWAQAGRYRHQVINREVPQAVAEICDLLMQYGDDAK